MIAFCAMATITSLHLFQSIHRSRTNTTIYREPFRFLKFSNSLFCIMTVNAIYRIM